MRAFRTGKRGRPRGANARDPVSHRAAADLGTPQLRAGKRALVADGDPALSEYPLGICLARGLVTRAQHDDGLHYAWLYGRVATGGARLHPSVQGLWSALASGFPDRANPDGIELAGPRLVRRFHAARAALRASGPAALAAVHDAAVHLQLPPILGRPGPEAAEAVLALRTGLDALVAHFAGRDRR